MRRTPRLIVYDRDTVVGAVVELQPATLVVDVQPFVAPWGCSSDAMLSGVVALAKYLADAAPNLRTLIFATNARPAFRQQLQRGRPMVTLIGAAHKPWRVAYLTGAPRPVVVLGDQIITDGMLAFRVHGLFLHWRAPGHIPWWPRLQAMIGALLIHFFFSPMRFCAPQATWRKSDQ